MKGFYSVTFFLLSTIFISTVLTKTTNPCQHVQDGVYINDPSSCSAYFKCIDGTAKSGNCPGDLWFDKISGGCHYQSEVDCKIEELTDPCKGQCDNVENECFVNNPASCAAYYYCKNGEAIEDECPEGLNFNPESRQCVYPKDFPCSDDGSETTPSNVCENIPNNVYVRDSKSCAKYYRCLGGKSETFNCAENAYFNLKTATCDKKDEVECEIDEDDVKPSCKGKPDGKFVKDPKTCAGWYRCVKDEAVSNGKCILGQWFDEENEVCEWSIKVPEEKCANRCEDKQKGFVVAPGTECVEYYNCLNGNINGGKQKCGENLVFDIDGEHCIVKEEDFVCASI